MSSSDELYHSMDFTIFAGHHDYSLKRTSSHVFANLAMLNRPIGEVKCYDVGELIAFLKALPDPPATTPATMPDSVKILAGSECQSVSRH